MRRFSLVLAGLVCLAGQSVWTSCSPTGGDDDEGPGTTGNAPIIERFDVEPGGGLPVGGGEVTLSWEVTGADTVSIEPDVGAVEGTEATITITQSTIFTLRAVNEEGSTAAGVPAFVASDDPLPIDRTAETAVHQIEGALARGEIDEVTAIRYKVFALHGDPRLPSEFDANGPIHGTRVMKELARRFGDLPAEVQREMEPFQLPPYDPDSWYPGSDNDAATLVAQKQSIPIVDSLVVAGGDIIINWSESFTDAEEEFTTVVIARAIVHSYRRIRELLGPRQLLGDLQSENIYPVYVVNQQSVDDENDGALGWLVPRTDGLSHIVINFYSIRRQIAEGDFLYLSDLLAGTVAHELFHAFQETYEIDDDEDTEIWFRESTATWAEHYVYPWLNTEHQYADSYFKRAFWSLDYIPEDRGEGDECEVGPGCTYEYGGYLFHFFLSESLGSAIVRSFWEAASTRPEPGEPLPKILRAIDGVLGGNLADLWGEFALTNWNAGPIRDYENWDQLEDGVSKHEEDFNTIRVALGADELVMAPLRVQVNEPLGSGSLANVGIRYLSAQYHHVTFEDDVRSVLFANGLNENLQRGLPDELPIEVESDSYFVTIGLFDEDRDETLRTWALVKNQGVWQGPFDLSSVPFVAFCQDLPEERVEELVVVFTNANIGEGNTVPTVPRGLEPTLVASDIACGRWEGRAAGMEIATGNPGYTRSSFSEVELDDLVFTREPIPLDEIMKGSIGEMIGTHFFSSFLSPAYSFRLEEASVAWSVTRSSSNDFQSCIGDGALLLNQDQIFATFQTYNYFLPNDPDYRTYYIEVANQEALTYDFVCSETGSFTETENFRLRIDRFFPIEDGGVSIEGTVLENTENSVTTTIEEWTWELSATVEPATP